MEPLLPHLEAALGWLAEHADPDGDGFVEYIDATGRGLANQGWKDSGDAVRFHDGRLAEPPIALAEVQGYAYRAAIDGAALLDAFDRPGGERWRAHAAALADRFRARFWVTAGGYPALALDRDKQPVDALTSNIGHLLGTGLVDAGEERAIAEALAGRVDVRRLRAAHHVGAGQRVQPAVVPLRFGMDPRHRDRGRRAGPGRSTRGGGDAGGRAAGGRGGVRFPAARAVRGIRPR